jgi:hypothetical protein
MSTRYGRELLKEAVALGPPRGSVEGPPYDVIMLLYDAAKVALELGEDQELFLGKARSAYQAIEGLGERVQDEKMGHDE